MSSNDQVPDWAVSAISAILQTLKLKDPFTFYHCCRVGRAARRLAKSMGLNESEQNILEYSGLLHDVGKVGISEGILLKPGRLTDEEMTIMKDHAEMSCKIVEPLMNVAFFRFLIPGIRYHHEKFDGSGYPHKIGGEKIALPARIIAIVDTVDAMTNSRPYRNALSMDKAKEELIEFSGRQFDPNLVKIYLEAVKYWQDLEQPEADEKIVAQILQPGFKKAG